MKKILLFILLAVVTLSVASCGFLPAKEKSNSLSDIQNIVRETQTAFENNDYEGTQNGLSKLLELSNEPFYSESERLIAQFCATYINAGVMLDYIIKNDKQWVTTQNLDEFEILYRGLFVDVVNGRMTHTETLKEYLSGLVRATQQIYSHYTELIGE